MATRRLSLFGGGSGGGGQFALVASGVSPSGGAAGGGEEVEYNPVPLRRYVGATLFLFFSAAFWFYWAAFPLVNTIFLDGYPGRYDRFVTARYTFDWWNVWLLGLNALVPITFSMALTNNSIEEYGRLHKFFSIMAIVLNLYVIAVTTFMWLAFTNTSFSAGISGNDYRYCCAFFPSDWCPNTVPCVPAVASGALSRNAEATQHWVFAFVFFVLACWNTSINGDLKEFGVIH
jgi:hypothetical protein